MYVPIYFFLAGHKIGGLGPTMYTIKYGGYNFNEFNSLHKNATVIFQ